MTDTSQITDPNPRPRKVTDEDKELLSSARYLLTEKAPWIAKAVFQCPVLDVPGAGYNATDSKGRIYVDFSAITEDENLPEGRDTARLAAYLLIGLWRVLRDHDARGEMYANGRTREHWSVSSTAVCSRDAVRTLLSDGRPETTLDDPMAGADTNDLLPIPAHTPLSLQRAYSLDFTRSYQLGRSTETVGVEDVYDALVHALPPEDNDQGESDGDSDQGDDQDGSGQGESGQDGDQDGDGQGEGQNGEGQDGDDQDGDQDGQGSGQADDQDGQDDGQGSGQGSGQGGGQGGSGVPSDAAFRTMDPSGADDAGANGLSPSDKELMQHQVAKDISDAAQSGSGIGNSLPESVTEWSADQLADPILSPHSLFRTRVGGKLDHARSGRAGTYRKRSRRQSGVGSNVVIKGRVQRIEDVYVGVDVSGSRSDKELSRDFSEVANLASERSLRVKYFSVSTMPHGVRDLARGEEPVFDRDQAGTDMRVAFDLFDIYDAQARILMTDGYTPWPTEVDPSTHTIVAITAETEDEYERVAESVTPGIETVWLPPVE